MNAMENKHWQIVREILAKYPYRFYLFGSRAKGNARQFSDLDICYRENIPDSVVALIAGDFEESDLPFTVDLVGFSQMTPEFRAKIEKDLILII